MKGKLHHVFPRRMQTGRLQQKQTGRQSESYAYHSFLRNAKISRLFFLLKGFLGGNGIQPDLWKSQFFIRYKTIVV